MPLMPTAPMRTVSLGATLRVWIHGPARVAELSSTADCLMKALLEGVNQFWGKRTPPKIPTRSRKNVHCSLLPHRQGFSSCLCPEHPCAPRPILRRAGFAANARAGRARASTVRPNCNMERVLLVCYLPIQRIHAPLPQLDSLDALGSGSLVDGARDMEFFRGSQRIPNAQILANLCAAPPAHMGCTALSNVVSTRLHRVLHPRSTIQWGRRHFSPFADCVPCLPFS